uniref:Uncharacterized protein n=1 Tax=Arundo donax TaxID=35708 RepID=A0A0A9AQ21_ARUDO
MFVVNFPCQCSFAHSTTSNNRHDFVCTLPICQHINQFIFLIFDITQSIIIRHQCPRKFGPSSQAFLVDFLKS